MPADSIPRMDSNGSNNEDNLASSPQNIVNQRETGRIRTESESSDKLARFFLPSVDGTPPKVMTLDEVSSVVKNIKNMELVHEIALNPEFKLQPYEPPANSLESRIKEIMHRAFWDVLREELERTPPCFNNALQLLNDIKECFPQILSQNNDRALEHINSVLDEDVIRQQAEKGTLDFRSYANFVINILVKSCAPARDEMIQKLTTIEDVVDTFRGILEAMSVMKLDMANYLLDYARNDLLLHTVEYEKERFKEYLEYYKFGFPATENWLQRNRTYNAENVPSTADQTITNAYIELMDWNESNEFPEVLFMDRPRFFNFAIRGHRLCVAATIMIFCSSIDVIAERQKSRMDLAKQIEIFLQDANSKREISEVVLNIWEQIKKLINDNLKEAEKPEMKTDIENMLKSQILDVASAESSVRSLMWKRLQACFRIALCAKPGKMPAAPPGFNDFRETFDAYLSGMKRIVGYNHSVFGDYFLEILNKSKTLENTNAAATTTTTTATNESSDGTALTLIEPMSKLDIATGSKKTQ